MVAKGPQPAPFFNEGNEGVEIHPQISAAAPDAHIVRKQFADSFDDTELQSLLQALQIDELLLCGMMTQNCVTHTALSEQAAAYRISVIGDACASREVLLHQIALRALSRRIEIISSESLSG